MSAPKYNRPRPALRYHGGKWKLASWIISHFPEHRIYVEPYGGGASVLLRKPRAYAEVYNDLDEEIVNLFEVLRDEGERLKFLLRMTPFARSEFFDSYQVYQGTSIERARRTVIKSFMGFGSDAIVKKSGFRSNTTRAGTTPAEDWASYPGRLDVLIGRLQGVVIESRDALDLIKAHDHPDALFYLDPPYVHATRSSRKGYRHEMTEDDHKALSDIAHSVKGKVVISGYRSSLYDRLYKGWKRADKAALADGARKRVESIWMNY